MLTKRIIACLDVTGGRVVKGVQFQQLRDAGDPAELAAAHSAAGADEVVLLDISASHEKRATLVDTVRRTAKQLFIPFTVGGGIRSLDEAMAVFDAGADKVSINSAALADPFLITRIGDRYGSQAVIVAIDAKRINEGTKFEAYSGGGGDTQSFIDVFQRGRADAALAASIFHFGLRHLADLKEELQKVGIPMRWPC